MVIASHVMLQMTGTRPAESVRPPRPRVPILPALGHAHPPARAATALPRLTKPFSPDDLARGAAMAGWAEAGH